MKKIISTLIALLMMTMTVIAEEHQPMTNEETPTMISGLISLWADNGIYIDLPERSASVEGRFLYRLNKANTMSMIFDVENEQQPESWHYFVLRFPYNYKPSKDATILSISFFTECSVQEAMNLYDSLSYNLIDNEASRDVDEYTVCLLTFSNGSTMITIKKEQ